MRISPDNVVTVISKHLEMGQGTYTGLATLVAEELDAAWSQVAVEGAPADASRYNNLFWGNLQGTGGSTAIANSYEQMRQAGAAARSMLVEAAASHWQVPADEITVQEGVLSHAGSGRQANFGELADLAAQQPVPESVFLKEPGEFHLIGTRLPRKDSHSKVNGAAVFTLDVQLPGMLTALVARPPRFGARLKSFDAAAAKRIAGVEDVVRIPGGVAVLARDFWSAQRGRDACRLSAVRRSRIEPEQRQRQPEQSQSHNHRQTSTAHQFLPLSWYLVTKVPMIMSLQVFHGTGRHSR